MIDYLLNLAESEHMQDALFAADAAKHALTAGSDIRAILVLTGVAFLTIVPLTLINPSNCYSVGYGATIASMSLTMILSFGITVPRTAAELLVYVAFVYGVRLALFLWIRRLTVKSIREAGRVMEKFSFIQLFTATVVLSGLYTCMVSPALFALRREASLRALQWAGTVLALTGATLEAIADQHKYNIKRRHNIGYGEKRFEGPTGGLYAICRHPNFACEMSVYTGLFLGGVSSFDNVVAWICGTLGWISIIKIMIGAAKRFDKKQMNMYGGQTTFEEWRMKVKASVIPFIA